MDEPTFGPSLIYCWASRCHRTITLGAIEYLDDTRHGMVRQTMVLQDWPVSWCHSVEKYSAIVQNIVRFLLSAPGSKTRRSLNPVRATPV
jgi:hypothetical protein